MGPVTHFPLGVPRPITNVRTLYQVRKLDSALLKMDRMNINCLGLYENRWLTAGDLKPGTNRILFSWRDIHQQGFPMIFEKRFASSVISCCPKSERILVKIKASPFSLNIIAPTLGAYDQIWKDPRSDMKPKRWYDSWLVQGIWCSSYQHLVQHAPKKIHLYQSQFWSAVKNSWANSDANADSDQAFLGTKRETQSQTQVRLLSAERQQWLV